MNLGNLTLEDFVKAGWSAEDVKEIMNLSNKEETHKDEHEQTPPDTNEHEQTPPDKDEHEQTQADAELKKQLEEMQAQLTQTQKDLAAAQAVNRQKNFGDKNQKTDEELFSEFIANY